MDEKQMTPQEIKGIKTKICSKCKRKKLLAEFYKRGNGYLCSYCKECYRKRNNSLHRIDYNKKWKKDNQFYKRPEQRKKKAEFQKEYSQKPEVKFKNKAKRLFRTHKDKKGIKPQPCIFCDKEEKPEAHHPDYNKPLEIIWLCGWCHKKLHRIFEPALNLIQEYEELKKAIESAGEGLKEAIENIDYDVDDYELRADEGDYSPNDHEKMLINDYHQGFLDELREALKPILAKYKLRVDFLEKKLDKTSKK